MNVKNSYLMNAYSRQEISFTSGSGIRLWDNNGVEYIDAISGVAVTSLGHSHPEIASAIAEQASQLMHTSNLFKIDWQERLGEKLCSISGMERAFFCNSGAEANEAALKLARLHANANNVFDPVVVVMEGSFHGRTLATLSATGNPAVHSGFSPLVPGFMHIPFNDIESIHRLADQVPNIVAVLVEPVQGEGGVKAASQEFMQTIQHLCHEKNWLFMVDEVQTGMGRTGAWFGHQNVDVEPDVITLAKALGNGFPIGACLARGNAAKLISPGKHASTFGGNPLACRVGCSVVDIMERDKVPDNALIQGKRLLQGLKAELGHHPEVIAIRGEGLMIGIELSYPCESMVKRALTEHRILINVTRKNIIRLLPPLICNENETDEIVARISDLVRTTNRH
ncbi:aspartate aminotransferase family protein [Marinobacterium iners]|uniref:Acetylornithine aminotransferase n=1 Tax=Marinobacterium iners DSM 11526 TaxID=1122198 RepID=A0A1H4EK26_9GAMM|nr:aspartate aminotransferase family protein [Marinobacterium iners]SEA85286.1 acetylornithine aminotransferase [Marinobacterium iners DSM 11526]